jgi:hypothetical protein
MQNVFAAVETTVRLDEFSISKSIPDLGTLTNIILRNAFVIAGVVTLFLLIFGGFGFIMSAGSGDAKGMEKGKQAITGALIGLVLIVLSASIVALIETLTSTKGQLLGQ